MVRERAQEYCEYCRSPERFSPQPFSVEHYIPRSKGGKTILENLVLSCQGCNNHKYTKTHALDPVSGETVPLYHPREQHWPDYFTWSDDLTRVIGLTVVGRATVDALQLNRRGLVNLRHALYIYGAHPPLD